MLHLHKRFIEEGIVKNILKSKVGNATLDFTIGAVLSPLVMSRIAKKPKQIKDYLKMITNRVPEKYKTPVAVRAGIATGTAATVGLPSYAGYKLYKGVKNKKKETNLDKIKNKIEELKNKD